MYISPTHSRKHYFQKRFPIYTILFLSIFLVLSFLFIFISAGSAKAKDQIKLSKDDKAVDSLSDLQFTTDQILVKIKPEAHKKLKNKQNPNFSDTGISSIDGINKKFKAKSMEKIFNKGSSDSVLDRWFVINFNTERKVGKGNPSKVPANISNFTQLTMGALMHSYKMLEDIESVEPNYLATASLVPNDLYYSTRQLFTDHDDLWGLKKIGMEQAWDTATGNSVIVAVLDTGVDYNHPDLQERILRDDSNQIIGYDFANNDSDPMDDHFHGTHVAGTIAASGNNDPDHTQDNGTRIVGVGWNLKIMPIKGLNAAGYGYSSNLVNGLKYAADNGAKVVNNSWSCYCTTSIYADALKYIYEKGTIAVFSAGNSNTDVLKFDPSGDPYAITVGASNYLDQRACFSNYGLGVDFVAPGGDAAYCGGTDDYILSSRLTNATQISATLGDKYAIARGTSMSAPHVSGAIGIILSAHPDYSIEEARSLLRNTADKIDGVDWNDSTGFGRINVSQALVFASIPPVAHLTLPEATMAIIYGPNTSIPITGLVSSRVGVKSWNIAIGLGKNPTAWTDIASGTSAASGILTNFNTGNLDTDTYTVKLEVTDTSNIISKDFARVNIDRQLLSGWPKPFYSLFEQPAFGDINGDGKNELVIASFNMIHAVGADGADIPGFPVYIDVPGSFTTYSNDPVIHDLDGDGKPEVTITTHHAYAADSPVYSRIFVIKGDGTIMQGWPVVVPNETRVFAPATVADIDDDGKAEILINARVNGKIYAYKTDGTVVSGWPVSTSPTSESADYNPRDGAVAVSDLNGDGKKEVFIGNYNGSVYGFNYDGSVLSGWPQSMGSSPIHSTVGIADINGDNQKEIVAKMTPDSSIPMAGKIIAWNKNGDKLWSIDTQDGGNGAGSPGFADLATSPGFETFISLDYASAPKRFLGLSGSGENIAGWPVNDFFSSNAAVSIGDLTGDGIPEVISGSNYGNITALNSNGQIVWKRNYGYFATGPSLGDFDGDGSLDMAAGTFNENMYVWKFENIQLPPNTLVWPEYMWNSSHTGTYLNQTVISIEPQADTYVKSYSPNTNYGTKESIQVKGGNQTKIAYMKFDLRSLYGNTITGIKLRMYVKNGSKAAQNVKIVPDNSWNETTINFKNKPTIGNLITSFQPGTANNVWAQVDLTSAIASYAGKIISLAIDSTNTNEYEFYSKEYTKNKSFHPNLTIEYR